MRFLLLFLLVHVTNFLSISCFGQDTLALERPILRSSVSKLNVEILGMSLTYERRLSSATSTSLEGQLVYDFSYRNSSIFGERFDYAISPLFLIEPRYYYNLSRRVKKKRSVKYNSGNYLGMSLGTKLGPIVAKGLDNQPVFVAIPCWGSQRRWGKRVSFEAKLGIATKFDLKEGGVEISPNIRLRIGLIL